MSRSGYSDDCDGWELIRWRGAVRSAMRGRRGQAFLRDVAAALDAMPAKRLIAGAIVSKDGEVCALGAVALCRGLDVSKLDAEDRHAVAEAFGIATALAAEIAYLNDDCCWTETPEARWQRMRTWVDESRDPAACSTEGGSSPSSTLVRALEVGAEGPIPSGSTHRDR